jgi:hypothetical protein
MYRLTGCSASQAVTWARDQRSGGFVVYVIVQSKTLHANPGGHTAVLSR